LSPINRPSR